MPCLCWCVHTAVCSRTCDKYQLSLCCFGRLGCCNLGLDSAWRNTHRLFPERGRREEEKGFLVLLIVYLWIFLYCMHIPTQLMDLVKTSFAQLYISPPQLCHTLNSSVGMLGSVGGSCGAALGSINFIAYFYNPTLSMHLPSQATASALTVHTAVKFCVSPCFMVACSSSHSRFLYLLL